MISAPNTLAGWLGYLEQLHPKTIDLGLERVAEVKRRLGLELACPVITVAGTNGKGSTCAMLEAILLAAGYRVGVYTSPHLLRYNERVRIDGAEASDQALCQAFAAVEEARGDLSLTYFEFGTLAAAWLFARAGLDAAILEVGLGGRLDAVNIFDADCAVLTSVDLDHMDYLGAGREAIGHEKAGVFRAGRPAVCGEPNLPRSVADQAEKIGANLVLIGRDFGFDGVEPNGHGESLPRIMTQRFAMAVPLSPSPLGETTSHSTRLQTTAAKSLVIPRALKDSDPLRAKARAESYAGEGDEVSLREFYVNQWRFWSATGLRIALPHPALRGAYQLGNAAVCLAVLERLKAKLPVAPDDIRRGLLTAAVPGRFQVLPGRPQRILDVAHNPHAAKALAATLGGMPPGGRKIAVFAMLRDKDMAGVVQAMKAQVDLWLVAGIGQPRGAEAGELLRVLEEAGLGARAEACPTVAEAYRRACDLAADDDKILVFGSFHTVAEAMVAAGR